MATTQSISKEKPPPEAQMVALVLRCPDCGTQRAFKVGGTLNDLHQRKMRFVSYDSECERCGRAFCMVLGWGEYREGFTTKRIDTDRLNCITVHDDLGLQCAR